VPRHAPCREHCCQSPGHSWCCRPAPWSSA
jgi:hypothetical protein